MSKPAAVRQNSILKGYMYGVITSNFLFQLVVLFTQANVSLLKNGEIMSKNFSLSSRGPLSILSCKHRVTMRMSITSLIQLQVINVHLVFTQKLCL